MQDLDELGARKFALIGVGLIGCIVHNKSLFMGKLGQYGLTSTLKHHSFLMKSLNQLLIVSIKNYLMSYFSSLTVLWSHRIWPQLKVPQSYQVTFFFSLLFYRKNYYSSTKDSIDVCTYYNIPTSMDFV